MQCIYIDPPYGIKFNSNFQWSTTSRDVKDGNAGHITREPEQVKAFRDTWRDGIHSYLTYLRDRLTVARDLLTESGSIFVQIGDENVHRVRAVMDEVFGDENFIAQSLRSKTTGPLGRTALQGITITSFGMQKTRSQSNIAAYFAKIVDRSRMTEQYRLMQTADGLAVASPTEDRRQLRNFVECRYYRTSNADLVRVRKERHV